MGEGAGSHHHRIWWLPVGLFVPRLGLPGRNSGDFRFLCDRSNA